jgi:hypothetical protein
MGFIERAIKKGISDALGEVIKNKIQSKDASSPFGYPPQNASLPVKQETNHTAIRAPITQVTDKSYFRAIIRECFSNYVVREDVPVSEFGGEGKPYDFALFSHGECSGVVMLVAHNRDNNRAYKGARAAAGANGVPFINFYTHMTIERGYVINRIGRLAKP